MEADDSYKSSKTEAQYVAIRRGARVDGSSRALLDMTGQKDVEIQELGETIKDGAQNGADLTVAAANRQAFVGRLRSVFGAEGPYIWGRRIGVSANTVKKWLDGLTEPGMQNLIALSEATGVTIEWLATGRGPRDGGAPTPERMPGMVVIDRQLLHQALEGADAILRRANELAAERGEPLVTIDLRSLAQVGGGLYEDLHWTKQSSLSQDLATVDGGERRGKVGKK